MFVIDHKKVSLIFCVIYHKPVCYFNVGICCHKRWKRMPLWWLFVIIHWSLWQITKISKKITKNCPTHWPRNNQWLIAENVQIFKTVWVKGSLLSLLFALFLSQYQFLKCTWNAWTQAWSFLMPCTMRPDKVLAPPKSILKKNERKELICFSTYHHFDLLVKIQHFCMGTKPVAFKNDCSLG